MNNLRKNSISILFTLTLTLLATTSLADDGNSITEDDYQTLCKIYNDVTSSDFDLSRKEGELAKNVQKKIPAFFERAFIHIMVADANRRYKLTQQYAEQANNIEWKCQAAHDYYATEFHTD